MVQVPYNRGVYIQRGSGLFSAISDFAVRYARPWFQRAVKTASSSLSKAAKSKHARNIVNNAKTAVQAGLYDAGKQILQGENIAQTLKNTASKTKDSITDNLKSEADKALDNWNSPKPKRTAVKRKSAVKTPSQPKRRKKRNLAISYRAII